MSFPVVALRDVANIAMGTAPPGTSYNTTGAGIPMIAGAGDYGTETPNPKKWTTEPTRVSRVGDLIVCVRATIGDLNWADKEYCLGRGVAGVRAINGKLDLRFAAHYINANRAELSKLGTGSTFLAIRRADLEGFPIPLPPLAEQKRIAAILDKADAIRKKRQQAIDLTEEFLRSAFEEMFGDPVTNPKGWKNQTLRAISTRFSDGPFGSNLKSSHYVKSGVRVIRLQNIAVGEFVDKAKAYISEEHFDSLRKHECLPGDVIIGTMGDPNLRACILPDHIEFALNKADCIQMRIDREKCTPEFVIYLLNHPGTLALVSHMLHGQTRVRVSMGTLRELSVPVPDIKLQQKFSDLVIATKPIRAKQEKSEACSEENFNSLAQRSFRGEL